MLKKHFHKILLLFTTLGITSLQAAHYVEQQGGKNDEQATSLAPNPSVGYYDYTQKNSKRTIKNRVYPDELEDQKKYLKDKYIAGTLQNKKGVICFMLIVSNTQTNVRSKFFFFNADPKIERDAIRRVQNLLRCHTITHTQVNLSPHVIFQVLGWLAQVQKKYVPLFIHASAPVCVACEAIITNFFNLTILSNAKGCNGANSIDLAGTCPLAQQYIKKNLTLPLAKKLLWPTLRVTYDNKLKLLVNKNNQLKQSLAQANEQATKLLLEKEDLQKSYNNLAVKKNKQIKTLKSFLKNRIELPCRPLKGHKDRVNSVAVTTDNKHIVSGSEDYTIRIWDLKTGKELPFSPLKGHKDRVNSVAITRDNTYIVSGSWDNTIRIWNLKTGKELPYSPLKGYIGGVFSMAVTTDNKYIVSGSGDKTIRIWDLKTGKEVAYSPLNSHTNWVKSVTVTNDNKYIVSGGGYQDKTIRIWDLKTGKELSYSPLKGHTNGSLSVAVTSDNKYIVSGSSDHTIRIWDIKAGKELSYSPLKGHTDRVHSVAVTTDNKFIVSGSYDKTIRIWDFKTGKEDPFSPFKGHKDEVYSVAVTSDNKYIVSGSTDNTIRIWDWKLLRYLDDEEEKEDNEMDNKVFDLD